MAEVLTESFCERCGTRYTFESSKPRVKRLKGVKVLSRGLKNFVLSDDSSLDEAMAAARSDTDREVTSQQLDAFHKTFNFCMTCRQYTCANCWNDVEGTCLTCSPHLGHEIMPAPFPDLDPLGMTVALGAADVAAPDGVSVTNGNGNGNGNGHVDAGPLPDAWPTSDGWPTQEIAVADDGQTPEPARYVADDMDEIDVEARMAALTAIGSGAVATPEADLPVEAAVETFGPEVVADAEVAAVAEPDQAAEVAAEAIAETVEPEAMAEDVVEAAVEAEPDQAAEVAAEAVAETVEPVSEVEVEAVAASVAEAESIAEPEPEAQVASDVAVAEPEVEVEVVAEAELEPELVADAPAEVATHPESIIEPSVAAESGSLTSDQVAAAASAQTAALLGRFRPGQNLDAEIEAYERDTVLDDRPIASSAPSAEPVAVSDLIIAAAVVHEPETEPVVAEPEPVAAPPEPELVVAEPEPVVAEPEPEPVAADRDVDLAAAAAASALAAAAAAPKASDVVTQPTWQIVAPDNEPAVAPPLPPLTTPPAAAPYQQPAAAAAQPEWPAKPEWPSQAPAAGLPFLGRLAQPTGGLDSLWAESNREVASVAPAPGRPAQVAAGVQPCVSCGLSLSATARFCRRCGTAQHA